MPHDLHVSSLKFMTNHLIILGPYLGNFHYPTALHYTRLMKNPADKWGPKHESISGILHNLLYIYCAWFHVAEIVSLCTPSTQIHSWSPTLNKKYTWLEFVVCIWDKKNLNRRKTTPASTTGSFAKANWGELHEYGQCKLCVNFLPFLWDVHERLQLDKCLAAFCIVLYNSTIQKSTKVSSLQRT
jgi:hypothetical protein